MSGFVFRFFSRGGVLLERFGDPEAPGGVDLLPARLYLADPRDGPDGLVAEMARQLPPERRIPWISADKRDQAASGVSAHNLGADAEAYIRSTPAYAGDSTLYDGEDD